MPRWQKRRIGNRERRVSEENARGLKVGGRGRAGFWFFICLRSAIRYRLGPPESDKFEQNYTLRRRGKCGFGAVFSFFDFYSNFTAHLFSITAIHSRARVALEKYCVNQSISRCYRMQSIAQTSQLGRETCHSIPMRANQHSCLPGNNARSLVRHDAC